MSSELVELYALLWQYRNDTLLLERRSIFPLCSVFLFLSRCVPSIAQLFISSCALPLWGKDQCHSCVSSVRVCARSPQVFTLSTLWAFAHIVLYVVIYNTSHHICCARSRWAISAAPSLRRPSSVAFPLHPLLRHRRLLLLRRRLLLRLQWLPPDASGRALVRVQAVGRSRFDCKTAARTGAFGKENLGIEGLTGS